ncbi:ABC transporter permease [Euzebya sp.]|uniref:ABC transporter permease n=1 Tax=Euzebya sp. TaxID=1971409 RepID=UPI0035197F44
MSVPTAIPAPTIPREGLRAALHDSVVLMGRNLRRYQRQPQIAVFIFIQPVMFVLLFRYVFGGSIPTPGVDYVQYLMPGIIVQSVTFATVGTAIGIAEDLKAGIIDRFRSLPMARAAVLAGRVLSDAFVNLLSLLVMLAVAYVVGFRITTSVVQAVAALGLIAAFSFAFAWIAAFIGLALKEPEAVQGAGFVWLFPLAFASSVFVVPATMPGWLTAFATQNPLSRVADAVRSLTVGGHPCGTSADAIDFCTGVQTNLLWGLGWAVVIVVVFLPLAARMWQRLE